MASPNTKQSFAEHNKEQAAAPALSLRGGGESTPSSQITSYDEVASLMRSRKCHSCNSSMIQTANNIEGLFEGWFDKRCSEISSRVSCKRCSTSNCMGCGGKPGGSESNTQVNVQGIKISWCCNHGALFIIWVLLCGFDKYYCLAKQSEAVKKGTGHNVAGSGVGYGGRYSSDDYYRYGRSRHSQSSNNTASKAKALSAQQETDFYDRFILAALAELLPSSDKKSSSDTNSQKAMLSMLLNSKILNKATELLRNDSLKDATKRSGLYQALLEFVRVIGTHKLMADRAIFSERTVWPDNINLLTLSFQGSNSSAKPDKVSSVAESLRNLNIQSDMMLKGAEGKHKEFSSSGSQQLLLLCRLICDISDILLSKASKGKDVAASDSTSAGKDCFVLETPDQQIFATHAYRQFANAQNQSPPGRMKRLITEVTTLKTGLPPGIFVKYASSRLDVMKIVIVGPSDTPYENGLFEFDLWCPSNFPFEPPKMRFKGTAEGRLAINPNLHPDGKVCLSLLGTWPGEPWRPAESTILQVLISIQAMVFSENPAANEPMYQSLPANSSAAMATNQGYRVFTVRWALIDWLENPKTLWQDVVTRHFKKNADKIMNTVKRWEQFRDRSHEMSLNLSMRTMLNMDQDRGLASISSLRPRLQKAIQKFLDPSSSNSGRATEQSRAQQNNERYGSNQHGSSRRGPSQHDSSRHGGYWY